MGLNGVALASLSILALLGLGHIHLSQFMKYEVNQLRAEFLHPPHSSAPSVIKKIDNTVDEYLPDVVLYRRTKKSGSTAMVKTLRGKLKALGYIDVNLVNPDMQWVARAAAISTYPQRFLFSNHNNLVRSDFRGKRVVIIDTIRDGYKQITSYCRFVRGVQSCGSELETCLLSNDSLNETKFRWAGREEEDEDTFIDIPLSSEHPFLSTKALRTVIPNLSIDLERANVRNSSCPELSSLRTIYKRHYSKLNRQIDLLKKRLLVITGYPYLVQGGNRGIKLDDLLDSAEKIEQQKHLTSIKESKKDSSAAASSLSFVALTSKYKRWLQDKEGKLLLK